MWPQGFTFVRDPVARFISGYTEVEWRYGAEPANEAQRRQGPVFQKRFKHARGTPERFREFVAGLVEGKMQTFSEIFHIKPQVVRMVGPLGGQPMVVGRLEDFPRSWRALQAHLDIPPDAQAEFDFSLCRHEGHAGLITQTSQVDGRIRIAVDPGDESGYICRQTC